MDFSQDHLMKELLGELLGEPYAKLCCFKFKNLETLAGELGQDAQILGPEHPLFSSFQRAQSNLYLILSHLELSGFVEFPKAILAGLLDPSLTSDKQEHWTKLISILSVLEQQKEQALSSSELISIEGIFKVEMCLENALECVKKIKNQDQDENLAA